MKSRIYEIGENGDDPVLDALGSSTRRRIIGLLAREPCNINTLATSLGISGPATTRHIQALEAAGLITTEYRPGAQGTQKVCTLCCDRLTLLFGNPQAPFVRVEEVEMPVGMYREARATPTCGLASAERIIGFLDDPISFFNPERSAAQVLWTADGFVEYVFPNTVSTSAVIDRLELSMEICSEAPDYNNDYPSDITVWINGVDIGTWTSPGDFGGRRGRLNPAWWSERYSQYGLLKVWTVDSDGTRVDGTTVSGVTLSDIGVRPKAVCTVRIGVKEDAEHRGGFVLYGQSFGTYEQDLLLRLSHVGHNGLAVIQKQLSQTAEPAGQIRAVANGALGA